MEIIVSQAGAWVKPILASVALSACASTAPTKEDAKVSQEGTDNLSWAPSSKQIEQLEERIRSEFQHSPPLAERVRFYAGLHQEDARKIIGFIYVPRIKGGGMDVGLDASVEPESRKAGIYLVGYKELPNRMGYVIDKTCSQIGLVYDIDKQTLDAFGCS